MKKLSNLLEHAETDADELKRLRSENDDLRAKLARAEAALVEHRKQLKILIDYVDANAQILDLPMGLRMRMKPVKALLNAEALDTAEQGE